MIFATCDKIFPVIRDFLVKQGGPYKKGVSRRTEENIIMGLATGQFVIKIKGGCIQWFACWRRFDDAERAESRIWHEDPLQGEHVCIMEAACTGSGIRAMVKAIRKKTKGLQGVCWHRPAKKDKFHHYPHQRGED